MFDKTMVRGLFTAALAVTALAGTAMADVMLPTGLTPGSQYQILLLTNSGTTAESTNIQDYDTFVTQQVDQDPTLAALGASWTAVASTSGSAANQASNSTNVRIYDTQGNFLEPNFPSLFSDGSFWGPQYTQTGILSQSAMVWTGSLPSGAEDPGFQMGSSEVILGYNNGGWMDSLGAPFNSNGLFSLYAISSPIIFEPVPEPTTLTLFGSALMGLGVVYLRRRGAKT